MYCANRSPKRQWIDKDVISSPTVSNYCHRNDWCTLRMWHYNIHMLSFKLKRTNMTQTRILDTGKWLCFLIEMTQSWTYRSNAVDTFLNWVKKSYGCMREVKTNQESNMKLDYSKVQNVNQRSQGENFLWSSNSIWHQYCVLII